jgi:tRNA (guanine-N7-)-methyltransferase
MAQKKLIRFAAIKSFPNVLEYPKEMGGKWQAFFEERSRQAALHPEAGMQQPLVLELACGKGEYTIGLAKMFPQKNCIGIDVKGNRMYIGAKQALDNGLSNAAFLRSEIDQITNYFAAGEISEIWITFPDPQLRRGKAKKRLTHPKFLRLYQQIVKAGGIIHLKTDSPVLYHFTRQVIHLYGLALLKDYNDVQQQATEPELLSIRTHYEGLNISGSGKIHYLQFSLPQTVLPDKDEVLKEWVFENESGE